MTEEIIIDECYFCDNGTCNIYPWTCDYDWNCKDNNECKVKKIFLELQRLKQENERLKEEKLYRGIDRQFIEDANDKLFYQAEKFRKALEEIRTFAKPIKENSCFGMQCGFIDFVLDTTNEVLK